MCDVPDGVVEGLCYFVLRFWRMFTSCIINCVVRVRVFSIGSQVVLVSWYMCCGPLDVFISAAVLWVAAHVG